MSDITTLKSNGEKLIVSKLKDFYRPMRLTEIATSLGCCRIHCGRLLKKLVDRGIIVEIEEFGNTFYHHACQAVVSSNQVVASSNQEVSPVPPESSPKPEQIELNSNKVKKERKKREKFCKGRFASEDDTAPTPGVLAR